jgi:hypothetical protein
VKEKAKHEIPKLITLREEWMKKDKSTELVTTPKKQGRWAYF